MLWRKMRLNWRYAGGEFAIVVLGVLAALWVENWNSERQDRALEVEYIESLLDDLDSDAESVERTLIRTKEIAGHDEMVLNAIEQQSIDASPDDFAYAVASTTRLTFPVVSRGTINDLMSTGNLRIIQDEVVRTGISDYYTALEWQSQWREVWRQNQLNLTPIMPDIMDRKLRNVIVNQDGDIPWMDKNVSVTADDAQQILMRLVEHATAYGAIENMYRVQSLNYRYTLDMGRELEKLRTLLERYLITLN